MIVVHCFLLTRELYFYSIVLYNVNHMHVIQNLKNIIKITNEEWNEL